MAKDPHKPFIIRSGDVGIRVLGTKFNFKSYTNTDCIELLLVDRAVQFDIDTDTRKQQLRMEPGDLVLYDRVSNDINSRRSNPNISNRSRTTGPSTSSICVCMTSR